jgi:hypothetical protein
MDAANLTKCRKVQIEVDKAGVHIKPAVPRKTMLWLSLSEISLLYKITPDLAHADELIQPLSNEAGN